MLSLSPIIRSLAIVVLVAFALPAGEQAAAAADTRRAGEYEVKAAFLYNFLKFIELPAKPEGASGDIRICILGDLPVVRPFEDLQDQSVGGRRIAVFPSRPLSSVRDCTVLFIASTEEARLSEIFKALGGAGTLTIGDTDGYARRGVMINFSVVEKKVRFHINVEAARRAGIGISSKLLKLSGKIYEHLPAGE